MKKKVTYIVSNINKALSFEWIAAHLNKEKFSLSFILLNNGNSELEDFLSQNDIPVDRITYRGKMDIPKSIIKACRILRKNKTDIIHTHLFEANIVGLTAGWLKRIPKRIQTRHHSNFHHINFPKSVKFDRFSNLLSTDIIAVSKTVKDVLINQESVSSKKVHVIHHGFLLEKFANVPEVEVKKIREKYSINHSKPVIGVISRYIDWKGIQFVIPAYIKLLKKYPDALLILANAFGDYKKEVQKMLEPIPRKNYIEIPFENNIFELYQLFDVFVHVPTSSKIEAFGQTYIESLAAGVPSVFTLSGIANEFVIHKKNAWVVDFENPEEIYLGLCEILTNKEFAEKLKEQGRKDVADIFNLSKMISKLEFIYNS